MKKILLSSVLGITLNICVAQNMDAPAQTPPMGWNSFNGYSCHIYEEVALKELDVFIESYAPKGYRYFVFDNGWFAEHERIEAEGYRLPLQQHADPDQVRIDDYGVVQPSVEGFPNGFKPFVDKLHKDGLKFGLHLMRGIPRKAVTQNTQIKGTKYRASDIVNTKDKCGWCSYMYGVDMNKPGAQEYYNSVIQQFADWGVDFIKVDNVIHKPMEIAAYRKAIDNCGRPIVLSLSPGKAAKESSVEETYTKANMFRVTADVWDKTVKFEEHFERYKIFMKFSRPGMWADLDMTVLGELCLLKREVNKKANKNIKSNPRFGGHMHHWCQFNTSQKMHFLGIRAIGSSPIMIGGSLLSMDKESRDMLLNDDFIACTKAGLPGKVVYDENNVFVISKQVRSGDWLFVGNTSRKGASVKLTPAMLGKRGTISCSYVWQDGQFKLPDSGHTLQLPAFGGILLKVSSHPSI